MHEPYYNIYKTARESGSGYTQERAAEYLGISVESLRLYETGKRIPPGGIVARMADIYNTPHLCAQHLKQDASATLLPELRDESPAAATLGLLAELRDIADIERSVIDITRDGEIDETEIADWAIIERELGELYTAAMQLFCSGKKAIARRVKEISKCKEEQKHA